MFMYANAPGLVGGTQASNFSFKHLSGLIRVNITVDGSEWGDALSDLSYITLVDANNKFVTEVGLDAAKIVAEGKAASTGSALYVANTAEYTNMLTANIEGMSGVSATSATEALSIYIPALPTQTGALKVVLYDGTNKKSAVYSAPAITVTPGGVADVNVSNVAARDFTSTVVTTEQALFDLVATGGQAAAGDVVELLGDIELGTLASPNDNGWSVDKAVTIKGGKIIVPAKKDGTGFTWTVKANATIDSDIEIENKGCCDVNNGKMVVGESTVGNLKVKLNGTIDNYGDIEFVSGVAVTTKNVTTITGKLNNHETLVKETGETNYATMTIEDLAQVDLEGATVVNDAEITIEAQGNNSSTADGYLTLDKNTSITNNYYLTNAGNIDNKGGKLVNEAEGWIIDRVSAQFGATQPVNNGGEYVCEVNGQTRLNYALGRYLTTRVRFINNDAQAYAVFGDMAKELYGTTNKGVTCGGYGAQAGYNKAAYDISGINVPNIDFEIAATTTAGEQIRFYSKDGSASEGAGSDVTIGKLIITSGALDVPNFVKYNAGKYVDAAFNVESIEIDGEEALSSKLQVKNINVTNNVEVLQMKDNTQMLTIGGIAGTNGSYELTDVKVGGKFIVGSTEKKEVAAVEFNNNNTTDIKGNFSLYENGTCNIKVATSTTIDNYAAEVWANGFDVDEGTWTETMVKVGDHPLWDAE